MFYIEYREPRAPYMYSIEDEECPSRAAAAAAAKLDADRHGDCLSDGERERALLFG